MYTEAQKMEKGIALSLLSFLGNTCHLKIDLPPGFPVLSALKPEQGLARNIAHPETGVAGERGQGLLSSTHRSCSVPQCMGLNTVPKPLFLSLSVNPHFVSPIISHQSHLFLYPTFKIL